MINELLLLYKKLTDTLIEQTKTKPQETLEFKMNKQMETFSFNPLIILVEEGKWLLGVTSFEATISVFHITDKNNSFSISLPGYWFSRGSVETVNRLLKLLGPKEQNDFDLHVKEVRRRESVIKIGDKGYEVSDFDSHKSEKIKNVESNDLEQMVFRMELLYHELAVILHTKYNDASTTRYTLKPGIYANIDNNLMLKSILPDDIKVNITIDDIRLISNLTTNKTTKFVVKSFFYTKLSFTQNLSGPLPDIEGFVP